MTIYRNTITKARRANRNSRAMTAVAVMLSNKIYRPTEQPFFLEPINNKQERAK